MTNQAAQTMHPDALPDGTLSKSTAKRVEVLAAASVSERARELLATEYDKIGLNGAATYIRSGQHGELDKAIIRALEQALTQQRGEPVAWRYVHVIDGDSGSWQPRENLTPAYRKRLTDDGCEFDFAYAATTPQPSADAVRELVRRILNWQPLTSINKADRLYQILIAAGIQFESVTDELESLLSAASDHQQNAAQGGGEK